MTRPAAMGCNPTAGHRLQAGAAQRRLHSSQPACSALLRPAGRRGERRWHTARLDDGAGLSECVLIFLTVKISVVHLDLLRRGISNEEMR